MAQNGSLTCDGTMTGAQLLFQPPGGVPIPTAPNTLTAPAAQQLTRVVFSTGGLHSCTVTNNSSIGKVDLIWASFLPGTPLTNAPRVLVYNIPPLNPVSPDTAPYRSQQQAVVSLVRGDGLVNVLYIDDASTFSGPQDYYDFVHPVDHQHYEMAIPAIQALAASFGVQIGIPAYTAVKSANYGTHNFATSSLSLSNLPNVPWVGTFNTASGFGALQFDVTGSENTADAQARWAMIFPVMRTRRSA